MTDPTPTGSTRLEKLYLKQYDMTNLINQQPNPSKDPSLSSYYLNLFWIKINPKKIRFDKSLQNWAAKDLTTLKFNILAQLANIPVCITMHKLLCLSKETRDALREVLANSESFLVQVLPPIKEEPTLPLPHHVSSFPNITFTLDILVKNFKHDQPLYYIEYIGSTKIERLLIDPYSALNIMPTHLIQFLCILIFRLAATTNTIYGFDAQSSWPMEKICLKCQISNLVKEMTYHVINSGTSYNLL